MTFYKVTNGNYSSGYFKKRKNAEKQVKEINKLCEVFKDRKDVDAKPCYIEEIKTED